MQWFPRIFSSHLFIRTKTKIRLKITKECPVLVGYTSVVSIWWKWQVIYRTEEFYAVQIEGFNGQCSFVTRQKENCFLSHQTQQTWSYTCVNTETNSANMHVHWCKFSLIGHFAFWLSSLLMSFLKMKQCRHYSCLSFNQNTNCTLNKCLNNETQLKDEYEKHEHKSGERFIIKKFTSVHIITESVWSRQERGKLTGFNSLSVKMPPPKEEAMNGNQPSHDMIPPQCIIHILLGGPLPSSASEVQAFLIFLAVINIVTFPFTAALNALVITAVKMKSRLRAHKSNTLLACLATTDLMVGVIAQPMFVGLIITIIIGDEAKTESCALQNLIPIFRIALFASLIHLALISGERYLAMKHTFAYHNGLVTEVRLLILSALAWLFALILHIPLLLETNKFLVVAISEGFIGLCIAVIVFCQITVYREVRRHEKEISTQQVTEEARQNFLKDKKAFKLTAIVVSVLFLCHLPGIVFRVVVINYRTSLSIKNTVCRSPFMLVGGNIELVSKSNYLLGQNETVSRSVYWVNL